MVEKEKQEISEALKAEEKLKSDWFILDLDGKLHKLEVKSGELSGFDFEKYPNLLKFAKYEITKQRVYEKEPSHIALMKKLELVDFEKGSDPGNLRYYPNGRFVKKMIENLVSRRVAEYGGMEIEAPIMYDYEHPSLKSYMHRFPARQYVVESLKRKFFLRFAACFGQFLMMHDANISYRNLPLRLFELTKYSFRLEQSGELCGLKRLRAFTMPDCHAFVKDYEQGKEEMLKRFNLSHELMTRIGFQIPNEFELGIRVVKEFHEQNKELVLNLVKTWKKPALVEMWDKRFFYFVMKYEWNFIDSVDKATALVTDQFDVENAERYGIKFTDEDGKQKYPIILHQSPSGAIERVIYALLERAAMNESQGKPGILPVWLSPEQVRLLPVADRHLEHAEKIAKEFQKNGIRIGVDDRSLGIPKKVFQAKMAWVPFIIVIGDKEADADKLPVVVREKSEIKKDLIENFSVAELIKHIQKESDGIPPEPMPIPRLMSQRPIFVSRQ